MGSFSGENITGLETPNTSNKQHKTKRDNFIHILQKFSEQMNGKQF